LAVGREARRAAGPRREEDRPDREAGQHRLHTRAAEDAERQDHAPPPTRRGGEPAAGRHDDARRPDGRERDPGAGGRGLDGRGVNPQPGCNLVASFAVMVDHVVIVVQENHTTDNYFRGLAPYGGNVATDWPLSPNPPAHDQPHDRRAYFEWLTGATHGAHAQ